MKNKRAAHSEIIEKFQKKVEEIEKENNLHLQNNVSATFTNIFTLFLL